MGCAGSRNSENSEPTFEEFEIFIINEEKLLNLKSVNFEVYSGAIKRFDGI
jgi:hypothetical protein